MKLYTEMSGSIFSPLYPQSQPIETSVIFNITVKKGHIILMTIFEIGVNLKIVEKSPITGKLQSIKYSRDIKEYYSGSNSLLILVTRYERVNYYQKSKMSYVAIKGMYDSFPGEVLLSSKIFLLANYYCSYVHVTIN